MGTYDIALRDIFRNGGRLHARGVPDDIKSLDTMPSRQLSLPDLPPCPSSAKA